MPTSFANVYYVVLPARCGGDFTTPRYAYVQVDDPLEGLVRYAHCPAVALHIPGVLHIAVRGVKAAWILPVYGDVKAEAVGELPEAAKLPSVRRATYTKGRLYVEGPLERLDVERFRYRARLNFRIGKLYV